MRALGQYGLVALIGLATLAWGTSPCLYADLVLAIGDVDGCCCDCCCDVPPRPNTDECPACSTYGNMHELPPVGDPVSLEGVDAHISTAPTESGPAGTPSLAVIEREGDAPPGVAFRETVRLTR